MPGTYPQLLLSLFLREVPYTLVPAFTPPALLCPGGADLSDRFNGLRCASPMATISGPAGDKDQLLKAPKIISSERRSQPQFKSGDHRGLANTLSPIHPIHSHASHTSHLPGSAPTPFPGRPRVQRRGPMVRRIILCSDVCTLDTHAQRPAEHFTTEDTPPGGVRRVPSIK